MKFRAKCLAGLLAVFLGGAALPAFSAPAANDHRLADAAESKNNDALQTLLRRGPDVNATQADGSTALHWAVHWDDLEIVDQLIQAHADVNAANDYGATPLSLACTNGSAAMVDKLLTAGANPNSTMASGETPLMRCARTGSAAAVETLLAHKADVNASDKERGQTALMWAVAQKHPDVVEALIEGGADIDAHSTGGFTPLFFAARVGDTESAARLVAAGAKVNEAGPGGMTPLVLASASGQEDVGIFLLDKGADANARDGNGAAALHYAVFKGITALDGIRYANYVEHLFRPDLMELAKALLAHGANPNVRLEKDPRVGGSSGSLAVGATPFLLAAAAPDPEMMRLLADAGADGKIATESKLTPLMAAAGLARGQDFTADDKRLALEAAKIALELGSDVNAASEDGLTAMHGAALNGADGVVQFLADKGAKLDVRDKYQQTPLSIATGVRLPWIPYGDELGEIIQPSTRDLLLKLGAEPLDTPGYFKPPTEGSAAFQFNQSQRYGGVNDPAPK